MRGLVLVIGASVFACASGAPPYEEPLPPLRLPPPRTSAAASASASSSAAPSAESASTSPPNLLLQRRLRGPVATIEELCGKLCEIKRTLPAVPPIVEAAIATGEDPENPQPHTVESTFIALKSRDGWYGAVLFREGEGVEHLEIFNPPSVNGGVPMRRDRPVSFSGGLGRISTLESAATNEKVLLVVVRRAQPTEELVLVLCADRKGEPRCAELTLDPDNEAVDRGYGSNVLTVGYANGTITTYPVFED